MELISREECRDLMIFKYRDECGLTLHDALLTINQVRTIESRPKGEWIEGGRYSNHVCSICGEEAEDLQACGGCELLSDFCPHCGADMRGEEE